MEHERTHLEYKNIPAIPGSTLALESKAVMFPMSRIRGLSTALKLDISGFVLRFPGVSEAFWDLALDILSRQDFSKQVVKLI